MIRYSDLTSEQKSKICNGCGGKGGWINPPEFLFHASCNQHDFYYWRGGTEENRKKADKQFYAAMLIDVSKAVWYKRLYYKTLAFTYYSAVRLCGKKYFSYGPIKTILN